MNKTHIVVAELLPDLSADKLTLITINPWGFEPSSSVVGNAPKN